MVIMIHDKSSSDEFELLQSNELEAKFHVTTR